MSTRHDAGEPGVGRVINALLGRLTGDGIAGRGATSSRKSSPPSRRLGMMPMVSCCLTSSLLNSARRRAGIVRADLCAIRASAERCRAAGSSARLGQGRLATERGSRPFPLAFLDPQRPIEFLGKPIQRWWSRQDRVRLVEDHVPRAEGISFPDLVREPDDGCLPRKIATLSPTICDCVFTDISRA